MIPGLDSVLGGGGVSASSSATSGPATQGNQGVQIGGIQTGGTQGVNLTMIALIGGAVLLGLLLLKR